MKYTILFFLFHPILLLSQDLDKIPNSINQFGFDAGYQLSENSDYLLSPVSISAAIGMTYLGALGQTKEQIKNVFYYPEEPQFGKGFSALMDVFNNTDPNTTISMANKLWSAEGMIALNPEFVRKNKEYFNSDLASLNFKDPQKTSQTINDWVASETEDKILDLIDPSLITEDAVMVLTNALYFKSNWANKFDPKLTKKGNFTNDQKAKLTVDYMIGDGYYNAFEDEYVDIIELPYAGEQFSFLIILPKTSMSDLENQLVIENYNEWTGGMKKQKFELVQVPKFKSSSKLELKEMLIRLGMPSAFHGGNFDGMGITSGNIELSAVVHQTFMEFNEEGTEAAAATGVVVISRSAPQAPKKFIADRPFIYVLRHTASNSLLFIGKMSNPK